MKIQYKNLQFHLLLTLTLIYIFFITFQILPYYKYGDVFHYTQFYEGVKGVNFLDALELSKTTIDSSEPVYPFFAGISSRWLERTLFLSIANAALVICFFYSCRKYNVSPVITFFIANTNFYFYVLYFSAERLKFAIIFILLSIIFIDRAIKALTFFCFAILAHSQIILMFFGFIAKMLNPNFSNPIKFAKTILTYSVFFALIFILKDHITSKLEYYTESNSRFDDPLKIILFAVASFYYSSKNKIVYWLFPPLLFASAILGGGRVVIMGYFIFLFFSLQYKKGFNFAVIISAIYFLYKTIEFIENIIKYGDGFYI